MVQRLLSPDMCFPNLFDAHPPLDKNGFKVFQIDGNLGAVAGTTEMIVQSYDQKIILLAALPKHWTNGTLTGIRLRGDRHIDIVWADHLLSKCTIRAGKAGRRTVQYGLEKLILELHSGDSVAAVFPHMDKHSSMIA